MAVSFKVPKSPKRDIAATDAFLGVDLTNTGVSIDSYRSPNAPNMVRNVPGKIRKRMGYYKEILFGTKTNVNFASDTSAQSKQFLLEADEWTKLYDLIQKISFESSYTLYVEFDYASEEDFYIINESTVVEAAQPDEEGNYPHFSGTISCESTDEFTEVDVKSANEQAIYIKNFSIMQDKDSSYEWSPAPKYFVERESNDPIYGCHFLKKGTDGFDGDRVVNVNRVLNTSDEWDELEYSSSNDMANLYRIAEPVCMAQTVYVDFDYSAELTSGTFPAMYLNFGSSIETEKIYLENTQGEPRHISTEITFKSNYSDVIELMKDGFGVPFAVSFKIKNFSLVYEKDENFKWSPAPEDSKEKFYLKDMYNIQGEEFSTVSAIEKDTPSISGGSGNVEILQICTDDSHAGDYQYLTFDITTSLLDSGAQLDSTLFGILNSEGSNIHNDTYFFTSAFERITPKTGDYRKYHFEMFYYKENAAYIRAIVVGTYLKSGSTSSKAHISISNIKVRNFTVRDDYTVSSAWYLYHVGKDFYLRAHDKTDFRKVYSDANEHISRSWQINSNSYIIDGKEIYEFTIADGEDVHKIEGDYAYVPILTDAREPSGGGQTKEALNCLQPGFKERFYGATRVTKFQMSFGDLDDTPVKAWVADANMNFLPKTEGTDFTVNRETGEVTFNTAPGASPLQGEPNVEIQAYRTVDGYRDRITKCSFGVMFGVAGSPDRIFLSGNKEHPNWDFYSQFKNPTYFPDTGYSVLGSEQSAINGYAIVSNYLAAFKDGFDPSQAVFVREGDMLEDEEAGTSEPVFKLINTLQGEGVIAPYSVGYLQTEPVFLTKVGVYAITEQDITGEKYSQNRSFYLDGKLRKEPNLSSALAVVYDNQYVLALNGQLYILDGLQATRTDKSEPYSTRQYAGFYCTDIPAITLWTDDALCFGTADGKICRFYTDEEAITSYNDDGKPIYACWETPDLDGKLFYKNKTFRYFAARMMKAIKTSVKLYSKKLGIWTMNDQEAWQFIKEQSAVGTVFDFNDMDFNLLSFSADTTERVVHTKLRVKKVDKARFRLENGEYNEPFGLNDVALEYIESGNYKG